MTSSVDRRFYLVAIGGGYHLQSAHADEMDAIVAMAKFRLKHRHTCVVIRCGATGSRLSVRDCEDYIRVECGLPGEYVDSTWQRIAA